MDPEAFIFIGRSGCGKGTQKELLQKVLSERGVPNLAVYTGDRLREFIAGSGFVAQKTKQVVDSGKLVPSFVASTMWSRFLMESYGGKETLLFDGSPRTLYEAYEMEEALQFLGFIQPTVIYIDVSNEWAKDKMMKRKRADDSEEKINTRLAWFDTTVDQAINYYRAKSFYRFLRVNGEQTIEQVHAEIMLNLHFLPRAHTDVANMPKNDTVGAGAAMSVPASAVAPAPAVPAASLISAPNSPNVRQYKNPFGN